MRLNKRIKDDIIDKVMDKKYPTTKDLEFTNKLGEKALKSLNLKDGWENYIEYMTTTSTVYIYPTSKSYYRESIECNVPTLIPNSKVYLYIKAGIDDIQLCTSGVNVYNKYKEWLANRSKFREDLEYALASISTDKQLKENMPKLVKYLPMENLGSLIPVTTFDEINKKLRGL